MRVTDALAAAKLWLVSGDAADLPYLSEGLYALVTVETNAVESVSADESWRLYVNPSWVESARVEDLAREIAHQLWHLLLDHAGRARAVGVDKTTAAAWHSATDLSVCDALMGEGVAPPELSERVRLLRETWPDFDEHRSTEEYWEQACRLLSEPVSEGDGNRLARGGEAEEEIDEEEPEGSDDGGRDEGSASDGLHRAWELPPDADGGLEATQTDIIRRAVAIAYREAVRTRPGHAPGELDRWAERTADPRIPWGHLLAQATRRGVGWASGRTHTTYTRPNRRAASTPGVFLPGWRRQNPTVACIIDTSGSVDDVLLGRALDEVEGALKSLGVGNSDLTVVACDAAVQAVARVRTAEDAALAGGGGTDLRVALAALEEMRPRPTLAVVFTDGQTPWPMAPPVGCAVVVALLLHPEQEAPGDVPDWATAIECRSAT